MSEGVKLHYLGKIDKNIYSCISKDITTTDVVITNERIEHIEEHHPGDFELIEPFFHIALLNPDYILKDKKENTGLILKLIEENGLRIRIVLRVHTSSDLPEYKNSIISAWRINEKRWENYILNQKILYKNE